MGRMMACVGCEIWSMDYWRLHSLGYRIDMSYEVWVTSYEI